jgi:cobalt-zinc-cadmium efflux system outer membrane protein
MNESILERSEETLQLMQKALQAGKVDASDVLAAQDNLLSVRKEYVQVQHDYIDAVRALEVSTGGALSMSSGS